jgi:hypothetical protein
MSKIIHHNIEGQLSSYIREDYPLFVDFLKGYYEWLEAEGNPVSVLSNHLSYMDFENTVDEYVELLKREYIANVPESVIADKSLLIRYSRQFFQKIGTEQSFKFVFKILYNEDIEVYYPREDMLKPSNGKWFGTEQLMLISDRGRAEELLYRTISQTIELSPGNVTTATASVSRATKRYINGFIFVELFLTDIKGTFDYNYPVGAGDIQEWILPIGSTYEVVSSGMGYSSDSRLQYNGNSTFTVTSLSQRDGEVNGRYTTILQSNEITVRRNGLQLLGFGYNGETITHPDILIGDYIEIDYPVYEGYLIGNGIDSFGGITEVKFLDVPFGITHPQEYLGNEGGSGASIIISPGTLKAVDGYYVGSDGFLSDKDKLQDSEYYQEFSYVIRSSRDIQQYRDLIINLLHPAGMKLIGEVNILELIRLMIRDHSFDIIVPPKQITINAVDNNLYTRLSYIDDMKYKLSCFEYKTQHFLDVIPGDIFEDYTLPDTEPYNIAFTMIDRIIAGDYIEPGYITDGYFGNTIYERDICALQ